MKKLTFQTGDDSGPAQLIVDDIKLEGVFSFSFDTEQCVIKFLSGYEKTKRALGLAGFCLELVKAPLGRFEHYIATLSVNLSSHKNVHLPFHGSHRVESGTEGRCCYCGKSSRKDLSEPCPIKAN